MTDLTGKLMLHRYRLDLLLGRGGMAEVYKAWDNRRGVFLAIKLLYADLAEDVSFLRRFEREAQTLQTLQHPNIVRFYGLEQDGELAFLVMEYIDGTSLRTEIRRRAGPPAHPFEPDELLTLLRPVCAALGYAHHMGIAHCDVKPGNILIRRSGEPILSDFGIARLTEAISTTLALTGTPAYMAPEQWIGRDDLDARTDIYALGITLFEMVSGGEKPFTGETESLRGSTREKVRQEHLTQPPPPLSAYRSGAPAGLDHVVRRCLAKDPDQRYQSVEAFMAALEAVVEGARPAAPQIGSGLSGPADIPPAINAIAAGPGVPESAPPPVNAIAKHAAAAQRTGFRLPDRAAEVPEAKRGGAPGRTAPSLAPADQQDPAQPARTKLPRRAIPWLVAAIAFILVLGIGSILLERMSRDPGGDAATPVAGAFVQTLLTPTALPVRTATPTVTPISTPTPTATSVPTATPAFEKITADNLKQLKEIDRWEIETGEARPINFLAISPDGQRLAAADSRAQVTIWDTARGTPLQQIAAHSVYLHNLEFNPGGDLLVTCGKDEDDPDKYSAAVWDATGGKLLHRFAGEGIYSDAEFNPADGLLAIGLEDQDRIDLVDPRSGATKQEYEVKVPWSLGFAPDGKALYASGSTAYGYRIQLRSGEAALSTSIQGWSPFVRVSPDQRWVASRFLTNSKLIFICPLDGGRRDL